MKHADLLKGQESSGDIVLVISNKEFRRITEAVELASKAHPRRTSLKTLLRQLEEVEAW